MHHSSESIGAIAGALSKAQSELTNPEKSLTATISLPFSDGKPTGPSAMRRCPADSTSSAKSWAGMNSRSCRQRRSTRRPGLSG